ncbi:hypothetical protein AAVH_25536 [Aphelenchoides avenae]|nr:hypothetical protein AAVH_25536 [Aphelenchus avenae]
MHSSVESAKDSAIDSSNSERESSYPRDEPVRKVTLVTQDEDPRQQVRHGSPRAVETGTLVPRSPPVSRSPTPSSSMTQHKNVAFSVSDPCRMRHQLTTPPHAAPTSPVVEVAIRPMLSPTTLSPRSAIGNQHHSPVTATITVPFATSTIRARRRVPTPLSFCGVETTERLLLSPTFSPGGLYSPSIVF